jgi:hypothetical protein
MVVAPARIISPTCSDRATVSAVAGTTVATVFSPGDSTTSPVDMSTTDGVAVAVTVDPPDATVTSSAPSEAADVDERVGFPWAVVASTAFNTPDSADIRPASIVSAPVSAVSKTVADAFRTVPGSVTTNRSVAPSTVAAASTSAPTADKVAVSSAPPTDDVAGVLSAPAANDVSSASTTDATTPVRTPGTDADVVSAAPSDNAVAPVRPPASPIAPDSGAVSGAAFDADNTPVDWVVVVTDPISGDVWAAVGVASPTSTPAVTGLTDADADVIDPASINTNVAVSGDAVAATVAAPSACVVSAVPATDATAPTVAAPSACVVSVAPATDATAPTVAAPSACVVSVAPATDATAPTVAVETDKVAVSPLSSVDARLGVSPPASDVPGVSGAVSGAAFDADNSPVGWVVVASDAVSAAPGAETTPATSDATVCVVPGVTVAILSVTPAASLVIKISVEDRGVTVDVVSDPASRLSAPSKTKLTDAVCGGEYDCRSKSTSPLSGAL